MSENKEFQKVSQKRLPQLDGIKGLCCLVIFCLHYNNRNGYSFPFKFIPGKIIQNASYFVEMFFIISGFLIAYSQKDRIKNEPLKPFLLGKLKRFYPSILFITILDVCVFIFDMVMTGGEYASSFYHYNISLYNVIKSLSFSSTWIFNGEPFPTVVWYIHVLFLCYLVYFCICQAKDNFYYCFFTIIMLFVGAVLSIKEISFPFLFKNIGRGYFSFAIGVLIYEIQQKYEKKTLRNISLILLAITVIYMVIGKFISFDKAFGSIKMGLGTFLFPSLLIMSLNLKSFELFFSFKPFVLLGKISMAIYLTHVPIIDCFKIINIKTGKLDLMNLSTFCIILCTVLVFSIFWYFFIEKKLAKQLLNSLAKNNT